MTGIWNTVIVRALNTTITAKIQSGASVWRSTVPQFRTRIDELGVHFIHVRSPHPDALPLIRTHGWPGSIVEYLKVIGPGA